MTQKETPLKNWIKLLNGHVNSIKEEKKLDSFNELVKQLESCNCYTCRKNGRFEINNLDSFKKAYWES